MAKIEPLLCSSGAVRGQRGRSPNDKKFDVRGVLKSAIRLRHWKVALK